MNQSRSIISTPPNQIPPVEADEEGAEESGSSEWRHFSVPPELHGQRLDRALTQLVPEFSRNYFQQAIESACVALDGVVTFRAAHKLKAGVQLAIELKPTAQSQSFRPEAMSLNVVHEDEDLLVLDKPAGLVVHPAPGNWSGTLLNGLLARSVEAQHVPRAGIVHRLDKDTSGLMVVAKSRRVMDRLVQQIAAREVTRQYLAIAHGSWVGTKERTVNLPIGRDARNRLRMAVVDLSRQPGKEAVTHVKLLAMTSHASLIRCTLETGRTHQIRVHMANLGHPLLADVLYGGKVAAGLKRQALHAYRLAFQHPITGQNLTFLANLPPDLVQALSFCGLAYNPGIDPDAA